MATVRIEMIQPSRVRDVARFVELLELLGVPTDSDHPVSVVGSNLALVAQVGSDSIPLPSDDFADDESEQ